MRATTRDAAAFLHRDREIGTIAAGSRAHLILLDANPLADIALVSRINAVVVRGRLFNRAALARLVDEVSRRTFEAPDTVRSAPRSSV